MEGGEPGPDRRQQAAPAWAGTHGGSPAAGRTPPRIPAGPPAAPCEQHQLPWQQQLPCLSSLTTCHGRGSGVATQAIRLTCTNRPSHWHNAGLRPTRQGAPDHREGWPRSRQRARQTAKRVNRALLGISATPLPRRRSRVFAPLHVPRRCVHLPAHRGPPPLGGLAAGAPSAALRGEMCMTTTVGRTRG